MNNHRSPRKKAVAVLAFAVTAAVGTATPAHATDNSAPAGSTLSGPLNDLAIGSAPWTDFLVAMVQNIQGNLPGPLLGSSGATGSSGLWDWNLQPYK